MIKTDLHIHSCLSPCAEDAMTPEAIAAAAKKAGLALIALTDHNSARNCYAMAHSAAAVGLGFIPGMEVTTSEELHCICLFPDVPKASAFSRWLDTLRSNIPNRPSVFGRQTIVGNAGKRIEERELLFAARQISVTELPAAVRQYGGLIWCAHADRSYSSLYSVLGCWPKELTMDAVELCEAEVPADLPSGLPCLRASNAHRLLDLQSFGGFELPLKSADFAGLRDYLQKK